MKIIIPLGAILSIVLFLCSVWAAYNTDLPYVMQGFKKVVPESSHQPLTSNKNAKKITVNTQTLTSDIAPPNKLRESKIASNSVQLTWEFDKNESYTNEKPEYAQLSGFRVYRDGFEYADINANENKFIDTGLSPEQTYTYTIAVLTFNNTIVGIQSEPLEIKTISALLTPLTTYPTLKIKTYLAQGDSITEGQKVSPSQNYVKLTEKYLQTKYGPITTVNAGVSGQVTSTIAGRISQDIQDSQPDLVTIMVGLNDLHAHNGANMLAIKTDMVKILTAVQPSSTRLVLLLTIPVSNCCSNDELNNGKTDVWNKLYTDIAATNNIPLVDINTAMQKNGGIKLLQDKLHPNQTGHEIIAKAIKDKIEELTQ